MVHAALKPCSMKGGGEALPGSTAADKASPINMQHCLKLVLTHSCEQKPNPQTSPLSLPSPTLQHQRAWQAVEDGEDGEDGKQVDAVQLQRNKQAIERVTRQRALTAATAMSLT